MDKEEKKKLLIHIQGMRMEAKASLHHISVLARLTGRDFDEDTNKYLDRLDYLDRLEKELRK